MKTSISPRLGIMFRREYPPETLPEFSRKAEQLGFDEIWVVEDCFYGSGIASAAIALNCTKSISVGLGIMPAVVRNPVFAAMEIATLARLFPGRFLPGFGHGVAEWMHQVGAFPKSQLKALEEVTVVVRKLLVGDQVDFQGSFVHLDQAKLVHPPKEVPPVSLGIIGPKSLVLSGRVADGTILSEYSNPAYISWAKDQIANGYSKTSYSQKHFLTVFAFAHAGKDLKDSCRRIRPMMAEAIASGGIDTKLAPMGILKDVREIREKSGQKEIEKNIPDSWIKDLSIVGSQKDWKDAIARFGELGVDSVVLVPLPDSNPAEIEIFADHLP